MQTLHLRNKLNRFAPLFFSLLIVLAAGQVEAGGFRLLYSNDNLGELVGCG
jgi:hypothetical protein